MMTITFDLTIAIELMTYASTMRLKYNILYIPVCSKGSIYVKRAMGPWFFKLASQGYSGSILKAEDYS